MKLYFSGIASSREAQMLMSSGATDFLADLKDARNMPMGNPSGGACYALDSGAYRAWKAGRDLPITEWAADLWDLTEGTPFWPMDIDFATMPDVLGDPGATWDRWQQLDEMQRSRHPDLCEVARDAVPVWQWGAPIDHLEKMVRRCAPEFPKPLTVAIGGCVPWMREKSREDLDRLVDICRTYATDTTPAPFHVLGLNWLEAMDILAPLVRSCDTSKWLDGARYGTVIHDQGSGLIAEGKQHCRRGRERHHLCIESADTLHTYVNLGERQEAPRTFKKTRQYTLKKGSSAPVYKGPGKVNRLLSMHNKTEMEKKHEENKENLLLELEWKRGRR